MDVGTSRTPDESGFVQLGVDVAESSGPQLVRITGELPLEEVVAGRLGGAPRLELLSHRTDPGSESGQRIPGPGIDVGGQDPTKLGHHEGASRGHHRRDLVGEGPSATGRRCAHQGAANPAVQRGIDAVAEVGGELGETGLVIGQARIGLGVHALRLR